MKNIRIFLIGSGNVAWHLSTSLNKKGCHFIGIYNRTVQHAEELAKELHCPVFKNLEDVPCGADLYLICTSDRAIHFVTSLLSINNGITVHVSGATSIEAIDKKHNRRGIFYPLQTFKKNRKIDLQKVPFLIEAENQTDIDFLMHLGHSLSDMVIIANERQRKITHLAAVFACNFTNFMYVLAKDILKTSGLDFQLLLPLIKETSERMGQVDDPMSLQTGPAIRHDMETILQHVELLKDDPDLLQTYRILTELIINKISENQ